MREHGVILALDRLRDLAAEVLEASRTSPANAVIVAEALVAADADGIPSHGVARLPAYAEQAMSGKVDGFADPHVEQTAAAALRVDARDGFAFPAIRLGLTHALDVVARTGVVAVAVTRSHHFGEAGLHVEAAARAGFVALAFGNSPAAIAPWGGSRPVFGTNPIAFACPRRAGDPLIVDLSLSRTARGKIALAARRGEPIPAGWALDAAGQPTTDAAAALGGTLLPIEGPKGAALALIVELLAAALTGSHFGFEAGSFFDAHGAPPRVGQLFLVLDPSALGAAGFVDRVETLVAAMVDQPNVRLPGDRRLAARRAARRDGIDVPDGLYEDLRRRAARG